MDLKYNLTFNGKDFPLFKWQLGQVLQAKKLEYLLKVKPPIQKEDVVDEDTKDTYKYEVWKADDLKAQPILTCALQIEDQRRVMGCKSLFSMMDTLENVYAKQTSIRKTTLLRSLFACKMKDTDTMRTHVDSFMKIIQDLNASGVKTEDEIYPCIFFLSVSNTWSEVAERVEYRLTGTSPSTLTLSNATDQLLAEETMRTSRDNDPFKESGSALKTFGHSEFQRDACFNCGGKGHKARECPSPKKDEKPSAPPQQRQNSGFGRGRWQKKGITKKQSRENNGNGREERVNNGESIGGSVDGAVGSVGSGDSAVVFFANHRGTWGKSTSWCIDSGATHHMTANKNLFTAYERFSTPASVTVADGKVMEAVGQGKVALGVVNGMGWNTLRLEGVWFVPDLAHNLVSVRKLDQAGFRLEFGGGVSTISKNGVACAVTPYSSGMYNIVASDSQNDDNAAAFTSFVDPLLWHCRMGHANPQRLYQWGSDGFVDGMGKIPLVALEQCIACSKGKMTRKKIGKGPVPRATHAFERVFSDLCGPMEVPSLGGSRYFVTFIDDYSRTCWVQFLKTKDMVMDAYLNWEAFVVNKYNAKVKFFHTDNGGEYTGKVFEALLMERGIMHETTAPYTPEHNGVAERKNRSLLEAARCMLIHAGMELRFWAEAVAYACDISNVGPTKSVSKKTPLEALNGEKPSVGRFRVFGCRALALDQVGSNGKFAPRTKEMVYLGPGRDLGGYKLYNPVSKRVVYNRNVHFFETMAPVRPNVSNVDYGNPFLVPASIIDDVVLPAEGGVAPLEMPVVEELAGTSDAMVPLQRPSLPAPPPLPIAPATKTGWKTTDKINEFIRASSHEPDPGMRRSQRVVARGKYSDSEWALITRTGQLPASTPVAESGLMPASIPVADVPPASGPAPSSMDVVGTHCPEDTCGCKPTIPLPVEPCSQVLVSVGSTHLHEPLSAKIVEPTTYGQAIASPHGSKWKEAMETELKALHEQNTWDLVELPNNRKPISTKWVYKVKYTGTGIVERLKARLVARGFLQKKGVDYEQTYAPVAKMTSMRVLLAIAAWEGFEVEQLDVNSAYLHGLMDTEVFLTQPPGYKDKDNPNLVCRLNKSLYGLKQAGRIWNDAAHQAMIDLGFQRTSADYCVYIRRTAEGTCIVGLHVDDFVVIGSKAAIQVFLREFGDKFSIKELGSAKFVVGLQISQQGGEITLSQSTYVKGVVADLLGEEAYRSANTPISKYDVTQIVGGTEINPPVDVTEYKRIIGKIMYASVGTRVDVAYALGFLGRYSANPNELHMKAAKALLRYLRTFPNVSISYKKGSGTCKFHAYVDSDWGNSEDRKSTFGYLIKVGDAPISWQSKKQQTVATSSTEAEYMAMKETAKEIIWLRRLFSDLGHPQNGPTMLYEDNTGALELAYNPVHHNRTKHIDITYHFIREKVQAGEIEITHVSTNQQAADLLTKGVEREKWATQIKLIGLTFNPI